MASQDWFDKDFYKVLGVSKDVTAEELKKVYRKLARKYHPDNNPGDAKAEEKWRPSGPAYPMPPMKTSTSNSIDIEMVNCSGLMKRMESA